MTPSPTARAPSRQWALLLVLPLVLGSGGAAAGTEVGGRRDPPPPTAPAGGALSRIRPYVAAVPATAAPAPASFRERIEARLLGLAGAAQIEDAAPHAAAARLAGTLASLTAAAEPRAEIGVAVHDLETGAPIWHHEAERALNPASNQKLVTAIAAVELLGPDYRFDTRVLVSGDTLYVVGEGDPSLQLEDVAGLAAQAAATVAPGSVRRIVVDDTFFSARRDAPGYDDGGPGYSYLAPSGALSLQFNTVEITVRPGSAGAPPVVTTSPECAHVRVDNRATTARGGGLTVATAEDGDTTRVVVDGRISTRARTVRIRRRITDPGLYFGETFADRFAALADVPGPQVTRGRAPADATLVADHRSAPLPEVLASALSYSNNFTTEQVLRTLGARASGQPGDWDNGRRTIERFFTTIGRDLSELVFVNASGYSREGRISAEALVALLSLLSREGSASAALLASLPAPGSEGTLRRRLHRARGHVRAKTGTLGQASALSGIVRTEAGHRYGFSILVNGRLSTARSRRLQDRIVTALYELG